MKNKLKLTMRAGTDRFWWSWWWWRCCKLWCDLLLHRWLSHFKLKVFCASSGKHYSALYNTSTFQYTSSWKHFTLWPWMSLCLNTTQVAACIKFTLNDIKGQTNSPPPHFGRATMNTRWQRGRQPFPSGPCSSVKRYNRGALISHLWRCKKDRRSQLRG